MGNTNVDISDIMDVPSLANNDPVMHTDRCSVPGGVKNRKVLIHCGRQQTSLPSLALLSSISIVEGALFHINLDRIIVVFPYRTWIVALVV